MAKNQSINKSGYKIISHKLIHNACDFNLLKTIDLLYFKKEDLGHFILNYPESLFSAQPHLDIKKGTMLYSQNILEKKPKRNKATSLAHQNLRFR